VGLPCSEGERTRSLTGPGARRRGRFVGMAASPSEELYTLVNPDCIGVTKPGQMFTPAVTCIQEGTFRKPWRSVPLDRRELGVSDAGLQAPRMNEGAAFHRPLAARPELA
jgi:hypothetical protein